MYYSYNLIFYFCIYRAPFFLSTVGVPERSLSSFRRPAVFFSSFSVTSFSGSAVSAFSFSFALSFAAAARLLFCFALNREKRNYITHSQHMIIDNTGKRYVPG